MKRTLSILLAVAMLFGLLPLSAVAADKTPADFGWYTDNSNFSGWTADEDGTVFTVSYDGTNSKRMWKPMIEDPQNFEISLDVDILAVRGYVQVLGVMVEMNPSGGNGDQIYCPQYGNWFNAAGQAAKVTLSRENGGDLNVTLAGVNGDTVSFTRTPGDGSNTNLELGVIDAGGSALFSNLALGKEEEIPPAASDKSPADVGWYTDNNNFSGWTADEDGTVFTVSYDGTNSKRMWKPMIEDPQNFEISLDVDILAVRGYVQVLGVMVEMNPSGGNGDQIYCPQYGNWFNAAGQAAKVTLSRENGGDLNVTLAGVNGDTVTFSRTPVDGGNTNLELGVIDNGGSAYFCNLEIGVPAPEVPTISDPGWTLDANWSFDETTGVLQQNTAGGGFNLWKKTITGDYELSYVINMDTTAGVGSAACAYLRVWDGSNFHFLNWMVQRHESHTAIYTTLQFSSDSGNSWNQLHTPVWTNTSAASFKVTLRFVEAEKMVWTVSEATTGTVLLTQDVPVSSLSETFINSAKEFLLFAVTNGLVSYQNVNLTTILAEGEVDFDNVIFDDSKSPADFGWYTDNNNYTNWKTTQTGNPLYVSYNGSNSRRVWKEIIEDPENFAVVLTVKVENTRAYVEIMGVQIELNCNGGNGNQIFDRETWTWLDAAEQICEVTVARVNGGDLNVKLLGKGNTVPLTFTKTPVDVSSKNVLVGVMDSGASAYFVNVRDEGMAVLSPGLYGWETDEINGTKDFTGWVTIDGENISADYATTTGNHRIWKNLISDQENFFASLELTADNTSSGYVKVLGQTLELDGRNGTGEQLGVKLNGTFREWIPAAGGKAMVYLSRKAGGDVIVGILGEGSQTLYTANISSVEDNDNLEIGLYAGAVSFEEIQVRSDVVPFSKAVFAGDLVSGWSNALLAEMAEYQCRPVEASTVELSAQAICDKNADLIILAYGLEAMLSGTSAEDFAADYDQLIAAVKDEGTILLTGLPYVSDEALGQVSIETYGAYQAAIKTLAEENNLLFADLYAAMGDAPWTVTGNGKTLSASGEALVMGEILRQLMRNCPCLAACANSELMISSDAPVTLIQEALDSFASATTVEEMKAAVADPALGLSLTLYHDLTNEKQTLVLAALVAANRSALADHQAANALFLTETMKVTRTNRREEIQAAPFGTYVAVGDSITAGTCANTPEDNWVYTLGDLISGLQGSEVNTIDKGIGGTAMCRSILNDLYPAGKDVVQEYIVANHPDLISVAYGVNDLHYGVTLEEFISTYRSFLTELTAACPDAVILVFGICARRSDCSQSLGSDDEALRWNVAIKALAEEFGLLYMDTYFDTDGVDWLIADQVHPNNTGYRVFANAVLRQLNGYVNLLPAPAQPSEVSVKISHTVSFDSDLQMNYRIKYENIAAAVPGYVTEGAYLLVEKDRYPMGGGEKTVETVTLYPDLVSDPDRMLFSLPGIQSVEMGSELRAVLHFFDEAGKEYYTQIDTYSVLAYAQLCYDGYTYQEKPELYTLLIDCLNYGAAAQAAFDRRADEPVNAGMEAYQQYATTQLSSELTDVRTYVDNQRSITAVTAMGFSVNFADKTEINAKLTIADGYTKQDITAVKVLNENGEEVATLTEFTELDDGRLQVTFTGVKSVNMRDMYYFVAYVGEEIASQNVGYSVEAYARSNINSADAKLAQLVRATMYYGDAAASCFRAG